VFRLNPGDIAQKRSSLKATVLIAVALSLSTSLVAEKLTRDDPHAIPAGSKIWIESADGFDTFLTAAITKKKVPVMVVADREKADFEITAATASEKTSWAKVIFLSQTGSNEEASMKVVNRQTGAVVFAYSVHKRNSARGKQSSAEACAKHMKEIVVQ
jgi:hypothetical protein